MTKVLFYTDSDYFSGAEKVFFEVAIGMPDSIEYLVIANPAIKSKISSNYVHQEIPISYKASRSKLDFRKIFEYVGLINKFRPDVCLVNMQTPFANTFFLIAAKFSRVKVITAWHFAQEKYELSWPLRPIKLFAYWFAARCSDRIVTVSNWHASVLKNQFGFSPQKVKVIFNGVSDNKKFSIKDPSKNLRFLTVGTLGKDKGQLWLLSIFKEVKDSFFCTILGSGKDFDAIQAYIKDNRLNDCVDLAGYQNNTDHYYDNSDVLLHPTERENLSMAIIEAMAHGLPIITNSVGGNSELVVDGENGFLAHIQDVASWQAAIAKLAENPKLVTEMSRRSRELFLKKFTKDKMIEGYVKLINDTK